MFAFLRRSNKATLTTVRIVHSLLLVPQQQVFLAPLRVDQQHLFLVAIQHSTDLQALHHSLNSLNQTKNIPLLTTGILREDLANQLVNLTTVIPVRRLQEVLANILLLVLDIQLNSSHQAQRLTPHFLVLPQETVTKVDLPMHPNPLPLGHSTNLRLHKMLTTNLPVVLRISLHFLVLPQALVTKVDLPMYPNLIHKVDLVLLINLPEVLKISHRLLILEHRQEHRHLHQVPPNQITSKEDLHLHSLQAKLPKIHHFLQLLVQ